MSLLPIRDGRTPVGEASVAAALATQANAPDDAARVALPDAQRLLGLFTQGLSGRYLHLRSTDSLTGQFRPEGATTDGLAIYLPDSVRLFDQPAHNLGVYKISILHQLGFYENGTFSFSMVRARQLLPELPPESDHTPEHPVELERFFNLWRRPAVVRRLFMTLEDLRIDRAMLRRYPGARRDLERVLARALQDRPALPDGRLQPAATLWELLVRYTLGAQADQLLELDPTGQLARMLAAIEPVLQPGCTVYDSARATAACLRALADATRESTLDAGREVDETEETEGLPQEPGPQQAGSSDADAGDEEVDFIPDELFDGMPVDFRGEVRPELVQRQLRAGNIGTLLEAEAVEGLPGDEAPDTGKDDIRRSLSDQAALRRSFGETGRDARSFLYDEWDYLHSAYLKGWCRLFEYRLKGDDHSFADQLRERHGALAAQVKRQFRMIKPEAYHRVRRVSDGEEIELDGVIEAAVDRRAGHATDEHVYRRRNRALREVSAVFLLDMSASTDFAIPEPRPEPAADEPPREPDFDYAFYNDREPAPLGPKRRVIDIARESLALMAQALETLGDAYAIYGFSGYGHDNVEFNVAKDFGDPLNARAWAAMAAMQPRSSTRMGPAIRHAVAKLAVQPTRLKVLIVVSDGYPQDKDYGPDPRDDEYGIQDTARALLEAGHAGVQTFCVTVDPAGHDYLRRMCPDERYLVIEEVNDLPAELTKVYRALTA